MRSIDVHIFPIEDDVMEVFDLFADVAKERVAQILKGYDVDHDDEHSPFEFLQMIRDRITSRNGFTLTDEEHRKLLIEVAAMALAGIERVDRKAGGDVEPEAG